MAQENGAQFLGHGAPSGTPNDAQQYVDVDTTPMTQYFGYAGAWHVLGSPPVLMGFPVSLTDVPTDGQVLTFVAADGKWEAVTP